MVACKTVLDVIEGREVKERTLLPYEVVLKESTKQEIAKMRGISRFIGYIRVENEKNDIYSQENICADLLKNDCFYYKMWTLTQNQEWNIL